MKRIFYHISGVIVLALLVLTVGCQDNFSGGRYDTEDKMQIYDYVKGRSDLTSFLELMDYTGYYSLMSTAGNYTVFIPNNDAFTELFKFLSTPEKKITQISDMDKEFWLNYIKYHSIDSRIETSTFENGILDDPTLLGEDYYIVSDIRESYSAIKLNSRSTILEYNIEVANGLINIIDQVLLPPTNSIYDMLKSNGKYNTMLSIFEKTGYASFLKDSVVTLIVPTDDVLKRSNFEESAIENLTDWAAYHIFDKKRLFTGDMDRKTLTSLYPYESQTFTIDDLGKMWCNDIFGFSQKLTDGLDHVASNGVYHVLDTMLTIVPALPGERRHNLYGATGYDENGKLKYEQNCFTKSPASIVEDNGTPSFHQGQQSPIASFNATQIGEYFTTVIPDVIPAKYQVRLIYKTGNRINAMLVYNNQIINKDADLESPTGNFADFTTLQYKDLGVIDVERRGNVELLFQVSKMRRAPSACCDLLMDMIELIPVEQ